LTSTIWEYRIPAATPLGYLTDSGTVGGQSPVTRAEIEGQPTAEESAGSLDRAAEVSRLFREHNRALVLFLASRLKDIQAAREVAQEAYVRVLELENLSAVGFLRSYLFSIQRTDLWRRIVRGHMVLVTLRERRRFDGAALSVARRSLAC
jgi:hypothetical protein